MTMLYIKSGFINPQYIQEFAHLEFRALVKYLNENMQDRASNAEYHTYMDVNEDGEKYVVAGNFPREDAQIQNNYYLTGANTLIIDIYTSFSPYRYLASFAPIKAEQISEFIESMKKDPS